MRVEEAWPIGRVGDDAAHDAAVLPSFDGVKGDAMVHARRETKKSCMCTTCTNGGSKTCGFGESKRQFHFKCKARPAHNSEDALLSFLRGRVREHLVIARPSSSLASRAPRFPLNEYCEFAQNQQIVQPRWVLGHGRNLPLLLLLRGRCFPALAVERCDSFRQ